MTSQGFALVATAPRALLLLLLSLCALAGCRGPDICTDESPRGFATFREKTWGGYCTELEDRLREPLSYPIIELTEFFSEYPERIKSLSTQLNGYTQPEKCFRSKKEQLELRNLNACLQDVEETETRIQQAWRIRADPWLAEYQERVRRLDAALKDAERQADYIDQKIRQKSQVSAQVDDQMLAEYTSKLNELQGEVGSIDRAKDDYERFMGATMSYAAFNQFIEATYGEQLAFLFEDHDKNRFAIARLRNTERYFSYAVKSVGVACPDGPKTRIEQKVASEKLAKNLRDINAGPIVHVSELIQKEKAEDGAETESFKGFVCGERGIDNQFDKRLKLCARYPFELRRTKPAGPRTKWQDWEVVSFAEGDINQGVDCVLLSGS